jgi:NAD(P)-dependent dehydrogenase (short-subunit alcohol dehydrogenase family)
MSPVKHRRYSATLEITAKGGKALAIQCDVTDDAQVTSMVEHRLGTRSTGRNLQQWRRD